MKNPFLCGVLAASLFAISIAPAVRAQGTVATFPTSTYDGKLRPKEGAKYNMRFFIRSKMSQSASSDEQSKELPLRKIETVSIMKFGADYDIVSVDSFGNSQARITYGDFSLDVDTNADGRNLTIEEKAESKKLISSYLQVMKGATFLVKTNPNSKVIAVYGLDVMRAQILKKLDKLSSGVKMLGEASLSGFLSDKNAAKSFSELSGQMPSQPVRVSESWEYEVPLVVTLPIRSTVRGTRTLVSLKNDIATIKDVGEFNSETQDEEKGGPISNISGSQTSVTRITNATGLPLESTLMQTMNGTFTVRVRDKKIDTLFTAVNEMRFVMEEK